MTTAFPVHQKGRVRILIYSPGKFSAECRSRNNPVFDRSSTGNCAPHHHLAESTGGSGFAIPCNKRALRPFSPSPPARLVRSLPTARIAAWPRLWDPSGSWLLLFQAEQVQEPEPKFVFLSPFPLRKTDSVFEEQPRTCRVERRQTCSCTHSFLLELRSQIDRQLGSLLLSCFWMRVHGEWIPVPSLPRSFPQPYLRSPSA